MANDPHALALEVEALMSRYIPQEARPGSRYMLIAYFEGRGHLTATSLGTPLELLGFMRNVVERWEQALTLQPTRPVAQA